MPNRIIKESIRTSKTVNAMTDFQFRCWVYLITYVDDYGRGSADPELIKGLVFPRRKRTTESDIGKALAELAGMGCIRLYEIDGESYFYFPNWGEHQRIQTKKSRFPEPSTIDNGNPPYPTVYHGDPPPESESNPNTNPESESKGAARARAKSVSPSVVGDLDPRVREAFGEFVKSRAKLKRPLTERAVTLAINKLRELAGDDPDLQIKHIDQAVERGWLSFYPLQDKQTNARGGKSATSFADMYRAEFGEVTPDGS